VKCDVCGGIFSQRHLASHKRLAHTRNLASAAAPITQKEVIQKIVSLYESLSVQGRKRVLRLLTEKNQTDQKEGEIQ
jgi:hypothetical protein